MLVTLLRRPTHFSWFKVVVVVVVGNKDRHHFHFFNKFGNNSNFVLIDNGKG